MEPAFWPILQDTLRRNGRFAGKNIRNKYGTLLRELLYCAPWGPVYGELFTFDNPEIRLPAIDRLEGIRPAAPVSTAAFWFRRRTTEP